MKKTVVCIIFGGASFEHEVSIKSAYNVASSLDKDKYTLHLLAITKNGEWFYIGKDIEKIKGEWQKNSNHAIISPSPKDAGIIKFSEEGVKKVKIDVFIPVLHGQNGEDGTIQGLLELSNVPYVGSGVIGSAICMDKCITKALIENVGLPAAPWIALRAEQKTDYDLIEKKIGYPSFVKPANSGSSIGINKIKDRAELLTALKVAFEHDRKIILEKSIEDAIEIECSVIGNESPIVSTFLGQIISSNEFYDYNAKYVTNSKLVIPAKLSEAVTEKIKEYALLSYRICECKGMARIDFLVEEKNVYFNEINTIPGFTEISMFPKLWNEEDMSNTILLDKLIDFAIKRKQKI